MCHDHHPRHDPEARQLPLAEVAGRLAERLKQPLRVVHVAEDPRAPIVLGADEEHILGSVREELEREAARIRTATGAEVRPHLAAGPVVDALVSIAEWELAKRAASLERHVLEGEPAEQLCALALRVGADLIVAGARKRPATSRALLGSVALALVEASHVPVLLVPAPEL